jgi:hypothetical protein
MNPNYFLILQKTESYETTMLLHYNYNSYYSTTWSSILQLKNKILQYETGNNCPACQISSVWLR